MSDTDGGTVASGTVEVEWTIRAWKDNCTGAIEYDWIMDDGRGGYDESDELYATIEEAKQNLGVK